MSEAVAVTTGATTTGAIGEGVSVVIKTKGAGAGAVGVGGVVPDRLQPVKRNNPISRIDVSLLFMMISSSMTVDNYIPCP
jgi:hypothetical protein